MLNPAQMVPLNTNTMLRRIREVSFKIVQAQPLPKIFSKIANAME